MPKFAIELRNANPIRFGDEIEAYLGYDDDGDGIHNFRAKRVDLIKDTSYIPFWETEGQAVSAIRTLSDAFFDRYSPTVVEIED